MGSVTRVTMIPITEIVFESLLCIGKRGEECQQKRYNPVMNKF